MGNPVFLTSGVKRFMPCTIHFAMCSVSQKMQDGTIGVLAFLFFIEINEIVVHLFLFIPAFFNESFGRIRIDKV